MARAQTLAADAVAALVALRDRLVAAPHGDRRAMVEAHAASVGRSAHTVYGWLRDFAGYDSGRRPRSDAGRTRMAPDTLEAIAAMAREGVRANGKRTMPLAVCMNVAEANGLPVTVSEAHVARLLRQRRMDARSLSAARTTGELRSLHPNHVHQIDPSLCLLYYTPGGKQHLMTESKFYKNKLDAFAKVKLKCWRYVRYDHASGVVDVRYYEAEGENQAVLFDFLMWTWGRQDGRLNYGVPKLLLWDKGSANTSHAIQSLLDALDVKHETHAAGHAWAKGGVEQANNLVETHFESRLRLEPVDSVEQLNAAALSWSRDWNANLLTHIDSRLRRASSEPMVRDDLWNLILRTPGALVDMPPREVCQWFLAGKEAERQVRNLQITFAHPELGRSAAYDLRAWAEHIHNGQKVTVAPVLLRDGVLRVSIDRAGAEALVVEVQPQRDFDAFGRSADAQVIGEGYERAAPSAGERTARRLAEAAYGEGTTVDEAAKQREAGARPFATTNGGRGMRAHSHLGKEPQVARVLPAAAELQTDAVAQARRAVQAVETAPLSVVETAKRCRAALGDAWTAESYAWLAQRHPQGVQESEIDGLIDRLRGGARTAQPLRAVGGVA